MLQVAQLVKFLHRRDEEVARLVTVLRADYADFFEPNGEAGDEAVTFTEIGLKHGGREFALT